MNLIEIKKKIEEITVDLLKRGRDLCINNFSENIFYIIRNVEMQESSVNFSKGNNLDFIYENQLSIDELVEYIYANRSCISWIDFMLYYSEDEKTIIMAKLICDKGSSELNFHSSIQLPVEYVDSEDKFDVNWHLRNSMSSSF